MRRKVMAAGRVTGVNEEGDDVKVSADERK